MLRALIEAVWAWVPHMETQPVHPDELPELHLDAHWRWEGTAIVWGPFGLLLGVRAIPESYAHRPHPRPPARAAGPTRKGTTS